MKIETMWCVMDPSPVSILVDVLWEATPQKLAQAIVGMTVGRWRLEALDSLAIYTNEEEARADAVARLAKRDAAMAAPSPEKLTAKRIVGRKVVT